MQPLHVVDRDVDPTTIDSPQILLDVSELARHHPIRVGKECNNVLQCVLVPPLNPRAQTSTASLQQAFVLKPRCDTIPSICLRPLGKKKNKNILQAVLTSSTLNFESLEFKRLAPIVYAPWAHMEWIFGLRRRMLSPLSDLFDLNFTMRNTHAQRMNAI